MLPPKRKRPVPETEQASFYKRSVWDNGFSVPSGHLRTDTVPGFPAQTTETPATETGYGHSLSRKSYRITVTVPFFVQTNCSNVSLKTYT